ncbi:MULTISPECIES: DUF3574 domain-containing protein [Rhodopseudomonas]|uniref:DUF3574 domain-containing protein n=1 Tax=Rhodopseudomonas TaxID=1073 RepID=UPI000AC28E3F|nr:MULTISPECIES: DUF3574 domain-containing protein [Rhodopseudomonas]MDF3810415.1 DUF3574 domain-containing protein [Rhodopseudomonas sp. BAL398]WOK19605.1 DUF3574 domain-containing protein [Rhodopseudomonas sp. BAL398]
MRGSLAVAALLAVALSGCASLPQACVPPARLMASAELLFGRNIADRLGVSDKAFADFTAREITPRFPDGLTVIDANGQWRDTERGALVREPSKLVLIAFDDSTEKRAALAAIAQAYKARFKQQSVLTTLRSACVSF